MALLELLLVSSFVVLVIAILYYRSKATELESRLKDVSFRKQSLSVKYGKMTEQFIPFLETYPYEKQNFRFIGTPIDGIQFEKDRIIFVEFKAGSAALSERQKEIKNLVNRGKVEFREFHIT